MKVDTQFSKYLLRYVLGKKTASSIPSTPKKNIHLRQMAGNKWVKEGLEKQVKNNSKS